MNKQNRIIVLKNRISNLKDQLCNSKSKITELHNLIEYYTFLHEKCDKSRNKCVSFKDDNKFGSNL